eukprot:sb/3476472/
MEMLISWPCSRHALLKGNSRVQVFDMTTQRSLIRFGGEGSNPGQFSSPSGIASHEGMCYVSDTGNDRVQIFDNSGVFVTCLGLGELHAPRGEPTEISKQPIRTRYLGHVTGYQPISD